MDFTVMPLVFEWVNWQFNNADVIRLALEFKDSAGQIQALQMLHQAHTWSPLTLQGSGLFHLAFGSILGIAAWTHGQERIAVQEANASTPSQG
jgi:hypothetical protein